MSDTMKAVCIKKIVAQDDVRLPEKWRLELHLFKIYDFIIEKNRPEYYDSATYKVMDENFSYVKYKENTFAWFTKEEFENSFVVIEDESHLHKRI